MSLFGLQTAYRPKAGTRIFRVWEQAVTMSGLNRNQFYDETLESS
jgi:hypothetical protein